MDKIALLVAITTGCYLTYQFLGTSNVIKNIFYKRFSNEVAQLSLVIFSRVSGALLFGFIPILFQLIISKGELKIGLHVHFNSIALLIIVIIGLLAIVINSFAAKQPNNLEMYPQIRKKVWPKKLLWASAITWMLYLLGYEIMLRGVLFFNCVEMGGLWFALLINVSIYALIHLTKGMKETLGAIPMGIILCMVTFYTGTIWAAFWIHCILALSNEWFSIKYHPEMSLSK